MSETTEYLKGYAACARLSKEAFDALENSEVEIAALREENARLREEVERLKAEESCNDVLLEYAQAETQRLREENARLRAALKRMLLEFDFMVECGVIPDVRNDVIFEDAAAALKETGE